MGQIKMVCENIFNTKKKAHAIYHFNPLFRVCYIFQLNFYIFILLYLSFYCHCAECGGGVGWFF